MKNQYNSQKNMMYAQCDAFIWLKYFLKYNNIYFETIFYSYSIWEEETMLLLGCSVKISFLINRI